MRRKNEKVKRLKVKVIEDRKNGLTYEEIRKKRGVSPSTIAQWTSGKDLERYCKECGETDPEKLEEHHPDKEKSPHTVIGSGIRSKRSLTVKKKNSSGF